MPPMGAEWEPRCPGRSPQAHFSAAGLCIGTVLTCGNALELSPWRCVRSVATSGVRRLGPGPCAAFSDATHDGEPDRPTSQPGSQTPAPRQCPPRSGRQPAAGHSISALFHLRGKASHLPVMPMSVSCVATRSCSGSEVEPDKARRRVGVARRSAPHPLAKTPRCCRGSPLADLLRRVDRSESSSDDRPTTFIHGTPSGDLFM
jgi:hypothetical protein